MTNRIHIIHSNIFETCPVLMNTWKLGKLLQKKYIQNLTRCKIINSKSDENLKSWFKIWHVVNFLTQNLMRRKKADSKYDKTKSFQFKNMLFTNFSPFKIMLFGNYFIFKIMLSGNIFFSKSRFLKLHLKSKICAF